MRGSRCFRRFAVAFLASTWLVLTGCGDGKPTGTVSGTVKYKGALLAGGDLNFIGKNGTAAVGKIDPSGTFKLDGTLEADEYKVYFSSPPPQPTAPGTKAEKSKADLPGKFKDPQTSGVVVPIKSGKNELTIEFKD